MRFKYTLAERLWLKAERPPGSETCWRFTGHISQRGYGQIRGNDGATVSAHVAAWWLATGHWPLPGELICHDCPTGDDRACIRNDAPGWKAINGVLRPKFGHLWKGTAADNSADMIAKDRSHGGERHMSRLHPERLARGERVTGAKLTEDQVRDIRRRVAAGEKQVTLATEHRVCFDTINLIVHRKTWRHVL